MKPRLFIGSSVEGKPMADLIQANFTHDAYPTVWDQMVFTPSSYPLDSLLRAVTDHDFAILVLSPDDVLKIRDTTSVAPRGNVLFEAGLFIGKHGRDRCFLVQPRNHSAFRIPTDLEGVIPATYDENHYQNNPSAALGSACTQIRNGIKDSVSFNRAVKIVADLELADPATSALTYPKKLGFRVVNPTASTVLVTSRGFQMGKRLSGHVKRSSGVKNEFRVEFFAYKDSKGKDIYQSEYLLMPNASAKAWLALDTTSDDSIAVDALSKMEVGTWRFTCHWLAEPMERRDYEAQF